MLQNQININKSHHFGSVGDAELAAGLLQEQPAGDTSRYTGVCFHTT